MFEDFYKETFGYETIKTEHGFIVFGEVSFNNENHLYAELFYIKPEFRNHKKGLDLFNKFCDVARSRGINKVLGSVGLKINNAEKNLRLYFLHGFKIHSTLPNLIYLTKDLK